MNMADGFRWVVILACLFNVGVMAALFQRVGLSFLPKVPMRILFASNSLMMVALATATVARLHHPFNWRVSPLIALAASAQFVALAAIYHWYGTAEGKAHTERMMRPLTGADT